MVQDTGYRICGSQKRSKIFKFAVRNVRAGDVCMEAGVCIGVCIVRRSPCRYLLLTGRMYVYDSLWVARVVCTQLQMEGRCGPPVRMYMVLWRPREQGLMYICTYLTWFSPGPAVDHPRSMVREVLASGKGRYTCVLRYLS